MVFWWWFGGVAGTDEDLSEEEEADPSGVSEDPNPFSDIFYFLYYKF